MAKDCLSITVEESLRERLARACVRQVKGGRIPGVSTVARALIVEGLERDEQTAPRAAGTAGEHVTTNQEGAGR